MKGIQTQDHERLPRPVPQYRRIASRRCHGKLQRYSHEKYGLNPMWYYTTPGIAWDAALKILGRDQVAGDTM